MKILLTGASGFIGNLLARTLRDAGHSLTCVLRNPEQVSLPGVELLRLDFSRALKPSDWEAALRGMDVVVNTVGIFREKPGSSFDTLHRAAPCALFAAAARAGVRHVVNFSALGADEGAATAYHRSKKAADDYLLGLGIRASVVQPSLVYGPGGASAALFESLASLPLTPVPGRGGQMIQPVHVDDVLRAVAALVEQADGPSRRIAMAGPEPVSLRHYLAALRAAMRIGRKARFVPVPRAFMYFAARFARWMPGLPFDASALRMLDRGNTASADAIRALLGGRPRGPAEFVDPAYAAAVAAKARLRWLLPVLRFSVAVVWIVTGVVSLGLYPVHDSFALLARAGTPGWLMPVFLYGAAGLDFALGALTLLGRRSRRLWVAQALLVLFYTAVITWAMPEFWLHPYGPVLKNLPFLALLWLLYETEEGRWTTSR